MDGLEHLLFFKSYNINQFLKLNKTYCKIISNKLYSMRNCVIRFCIQILTLRRTYTVLSICTLLYK